MAVTRLERNRATALEWVNAQRVKRGLERWEELPPSFVQASPSSWRWYDPVLEVEESPGLRQIRLPECVRDALKERP